MKRAMIHAMSAMMPTIATGNSGMLPGVDRTNIAGYLQRARQQMGWIYHLLSGTASLVFVYAPPLTVRQWRRSYSLPDGIRYLHASKFLKRFPAFGNVIRLNAGMCWGSDPAIRTQLRLSVYEPDPEPGEARPASERHTSFRKKGEDFALEVDYVVVGSGAGGATAAFRLVQSGAKVAVVDSGSWRDSHQFPKSVLGATSQNLANGARTMVLGKNSWPIIQGRAVGGSTVINSAISVAPCDDIYEQWEKNFGIDGQRMRQEMRDADQSIAQFIAAIETPEGSQGEQDKLIHEAASNNGYQDSHFLRRYIRDCVGLNHCFRGCLADAKLSLDKVFIQRLVDIENGHLLSQATTTRINMEGKKAVGVSGHFSHPVDGKRGARFSVRAGKGVIIAASATGSPLLLKSSGIRNSHLGKGFQAHPGVAVFGIYPESIDINMVEPPSPTQGWGTLELRNRYGIKLETLASPMDMLSGRIPGSGPDLMRRLRQWRHIACIAVACRTESTGQVSRMPFLGTVVRHYTPSKSDMERFRHGVHEAAKLHVQAGATSIMTGIGGLPDEIPAAEINSILKASLDPADYPAVLSHLFGGCVMGKQPETSVCNEYGAVHGYEQLHVVDASVLPSNLGYNPQHTIMANAMRIAEKISAKN